MIDHDAHRGVAALVAFAATQMRAASARYRAGEQTAPEWQRQQLAHIKAVHIAAALAAYGGRAAMDQRKWGTVGQIIRQQYAYQAQFTADVLQGRQRQNGRMDARAALYAAAARITFVSILRREAQREGARFERNILGAADHSCPDCLQQAGLGFVPIGTLSQPGTRRCRANCQCTIETSRAASAHEAGLAAAS